jgi:hypothetical protein
MIGVAAAAATPDIIYEPSDRTKKVFFAGLCLVSVTSAISYIMAVYADKLRKNVVNGYDFTLDVQDFYESSCSRPVDEARNTWRIYVCQGFYALCIIPDTSDFFILFFLHSIVQHIRPWGGLKGSSSNLKEVSTRSSHASQEDISENKQIEISTIEV